MQVERLNKVYQLTQKNGVKNVPEILTKHVDVPFILSFKYPLEKGYTFRELQISNNKTLQKFLDCISQLTVQQVDMQYARKPDKNDTFNGMQVYHYEVGEHFRIHVVNEDGQYRIIRLDPNHQVHN